jgi:hypothetical protein
MAVERAGIVDCAFCERDVMSKFAIDAIVQEISGAK